MEVVLVMERKRHIETIKRVKKFIKEKESEEKSKSSDYIETLVEELM